MHKLTRRDWLLRVGGVSLGSFLTNCGGKQSNQRISTYSGKVQSTPQGRTLPLDAAPLENQILYEAASEPRHLDISRDIYGSGVAINWGGEPLLRRDIN